METNTLMVAGTEKANEVQYCNLHMYMLPSFLIFFYLHVSYAAAVLHPETHYKYHFSSNPEYARALTDAIEKMAETPEDVQAITEFGVFRESLGRFSRPIARAGASSMTPSKPL